jgi:diguanylate cyclase (GGDEF)-like protein
MAGSISDITEIKTIESQLATEATHDRLTGLPNRVLLLDRLRGAIESMNCQSQSFALLFLDFDRFKLINDNMGHEAGDELLRQIAARLTEGVSKADAFGGAIHENTIARWGGDEFVVLLEDFSCRDDVLALADRLLQSLAKTYHIGGQEISSTASIGVVFSCADYVRADDVVFDADMAMYDAKRNGKGCYVVFDNAARRRRQRRMQLESDLRLAIQTDQLQIEYEPIIDLDSGVVQSLEAHLCWNHPSLGRIESAEFVSIAEESGGASELTTWLLNTACSQLHDWRRDHGDTIPAALNINLSPRQFALPDLPEILSVTLARCKLQPSWLQLELTEVALADAMVESAHQIQCVRELGVRVAIDHFGVGTSSFTSLHRIAFDSLKIDRSMLADLKHSKQSASLIHGLAVIVRNIGISLVATGIESSEQLIALQGLGCDVAQGAYFGPPISAQRVVPFLLNHRSDSYQTQGATSFALRWAERLDGQVSTT